MSSPNPALARPAPLASAKELEALLGRARYLADPATALAAWLGLRMKRPVLLEGPAGVGKTDLARATAEALQARLKAGGFVVKAAPSVPTTT